MFLTRKFSSRPLFMTVYTLRRIGTFFLGVRTEECSYNFLRERTRMKRGDEEKYSGIQDLLEVDGNFDQR